MCVNCSLSAYQKKKPHLLRWRGALKKVNDATIHTAKAVQSGAYSCTAYAVELREMLRDVWSNLEGNRKVHATPPTGRAVLPFFFTTSLRGKAHMMREVKIENKPQIAGIERQLFFFLFCLGPANATLMDYRRIRVLLVESFASTGSLNLRFKTSRSKEYL